MIISLVISLVILLDLVIASLVLSLLIVSKKRDKIAEQLFDKYKDKK